MIDYTKVPLALVKQLKWKTVVNDYARAWTLHKVQIKWTTAKLLTR